MAAWGYSKENGPSTWCKSFPTALGKCQSPIPINREKCTPDAALKPIQTSYGGLDVGEVSNTGQSWKAQVTGGSSLLSGGPLSSDSKFILEQMHAHWGSNDKIGSEHTVDGIIYPAELHLVHWDSKKFKTFGEAAQAKNGLTVLGIFLKVGKAHPEMEKITKLLQHIPYKNQCINIAEKINCGNFLPDNGSYYTYDGSLTTPPLYESVNWIVYDQPIEVSSQQMDAMRSLKSYCKADKCPCDDLHGCIVDNYRPPQEINNRPVRTFKA